MLHDFDRNLRDLKHFEQRVVLSPKQWSSFVPPVPLDWQSVQFTGANRSNVPKERGIYAFVVQFQDHSVNPLRLPQHGYIMYVGITGHIGVTRTLYDRFGDYARERGKRIRIYSMLQKWSQHLFFHYATVPVGVALDQLELAINDAIIPPYVTGDFSAGVKPLVKALRAN